jgi:hypothetical protein
MRHRRLAVSLGAFTLLAVLAPRSEAHFILQAPASWMPQDSEGVPEKLGPCGDEDDDAMAPTGIVTAYKVGDTITITVNEVIFHPGHYRISLGNPSRSDLPAEPPVTAGATPCGTVPIEDPPVFPVLADNVFAHTTPFTSPQTTTVTLPPGVSCTQCTLQVIEFMSDHGLNIPGGCFYHHCANISIGPSDAGTTTPDASTPPSDASTSNPDASSPGGENEPTQSGGCGCDVPGAPVMLGAGSAMALLAGALTRLRRRRR